MTVVKGVPSVPAPLPDATPAGTHCWHPIDRTGPSKGMVFSLIPWPNAEACCRCSFARVPKLVRQVATVNGHGPYLSANQSTVEQGYDYYGPMKLGSAVPFVASEKEPACNPG